MAHSQLTQALLLATQTGDKNAVAYLENQERTNFASYMRDLCVELGTRERPIESRQQAGLSIKRALDTRDDKAAELLHQRWKALPLEIKASVKAMILQILQDPDAPIRKTAALAIGKIAIIEVPDKTWPELLPTLDNNITKQNNVGLKQSSLEALGYVCEEVPDGLDESANIILMAIATGMAVTETNLDIKLAATVCLINAVDFIKKNMSIQADRDTIMNLVFNVATTKQKPEIRVAAFQCLGQIASSYYEYLQPYMGNIFTLTTAAVQADVDEVAQQAIEFWSTIAHVELECIEEDEEEKENPQHKSSNLKFIQAAVQHFTPVLLVALTKQHEDPEDDDWSVALAAGTCLGVSSQVAGDAIVPHVLPFVQQHVSDANWRLRDASILAFGCILDGPNREQLAKVVKPAFAIILQKMQDPHEAVRDTTSWCVGRICSLLPEIIDAEILQGLMQALMQGLTQKPKIASNVCWAIHNLAGSVDVDEENNTSPLSPWFQPIVQALLTASMRPDVKECHLQVSIYEAINILVHTSAPDVAPLIYQVMPVIMNRLNQTSEERPQSEEDRGSLLEIQSLLCGTLQSIVTQLPVENVEPQADMLMTVLIKVLVQKNTTLHEEALMAIGAVADKVEDKFTKYMEHIKMPLLQGLTNAEEYYVCGVAVHVTCDVARAVKSAFKGWADDVMKILLGHLTNPSVVRTVKTGIISCLGDIALAVEGDFDRYLSYVLPMMVQASLITFPADDWDNQEYLQDLRASIIEAYSGILLGLSSGGPQKVQLFAQTPTVVDSILKLFSTISVDPNVSERVLRASCSLIFDLVRFIGPSAVGPLRNQGVSEIIKAASKAEDVATRDQAKEAQQCLR